MLSHDFTTKLTHINVSSSQVKKKKKQFSYNFTKKKYNHFSSLLSRKKKPFLCFFPSNCTTTQISAVSLVPAFREDVYVYFEVPMTSTYPAIVFRSPKTFVIRGNICQEYTLSTCLRRFVEMKTTSFPSHYHRLFFTNFFFSCIFFYSSDFSSTCFTTVSSHTTVVLSWFTYKLSCRAVVVEGRDGPVLSTYYTPLAARALRSHWAK